LLVLDYHAHPANEDHAVECQRAKQQQVRHISWVFNAERPAWRKHEEIGRSSAEHRAKKARIEPADQRCDYNGGEEGNELGAHNIWINNQPQRRGNTNGHDGKRVSAPSSSAGFHGGPRW
jgi:hypothetical protein